jgi:hypothetical protein
MSRTPYLTETYACYGIRGYTAFSISERYVFNMVIYRYANIFYFQNLSWQLRDIS